MSAVVACVQFGLFMFGGLAAVVSYLFGIHEGCEFLEQTMWIKMAIVVVALMYLLNLTINRSVEDDDGARKAEDLDELSVGQHDRRAATKLRMDLDLAAEAMDTSVLTAELTYPEWDYTHGVPSHGRSS